jgi:hypothetical protein
MNKAYDVYITVVASKILAPAVRRMTTWDQGFFKYLQRFAFTLFDVLKAWKVSRRIDQYLFGQGQ